jgi:hypothetical protein
VALVDVPVEPVLLTPYSGQAEDPAMISFVDWLPPALVGATMTLMGIVKLYGLSRGIVGGADKPFVIRLCGT